MIWSVAWRNIWRNKLRSSIILTAIAIGIFAGVFSWAFYSGMVKQRIQSAINTEASHIQIHHKKYLADPDVKFNINTSKQIVDAISQTEGVTAISERVLVNGMALSAQTGTGVKVMGINPQDEMQVTNLYTKVIEGTYLDSSRNNSVLIGAELAEKLNVKMRSKIVLYLQGMDGTMIRSQFRVSGIYKTSNSTYEEMNVFVKANDIRKLIQMDQNAGHELAILLESNERVPELASAFAKRYSDYDVKTWREIMPEVSVVEESFNISMYFFMIVILLALCFGIINTMLMAVLERMKELGMLMAIGMNKMRVFFMIVLETILLSLSGGIVGILIASGFTIVMSKAGIDLSQFGAAYGALGYDSIVYPILSLSIVLRVTILVIVAGFLSSIYPAIKALKLNPADAIRIDV